MTSAIRAAMVCAALAFSLRFLAQGALPLDYDEAIYLNGAQAYAHAVRAGNWAALRTDASSENPQLMKLVFGGAVLAVSPADPIPMLPNVEAPASVLHAARIAAVALGAMHAAVLAFVDPVAGLLLAANSGHIKYTSLVMLEAAPGLSALLCVLAHRRARGRWGAWMAASAVMLGLTAAGKYLYCVAALAVVVDAVHGARRRSLRSLWPILPWGVLAIVVFIAVSPHLWSDPIGGVRDSLLFHVRNASASESAVNTSKFVWWQPLGWLGASVPRSDAVPLRPDAVIAVAAALGVPALWRRRRVFAWWLLIGLAALLVFPNKWPQYALIVATPLCMAAGCAVREAANAVRRRTIPRAWLISAALGVACAAGVAFLADDPYNADPAFRRATRTVQDAIAPDEIAFTVFADPAVRAAVLEPGWRSWNELPLAAADDVPHGMLGYDGAATLLNRAAGRHGVWLLTYQKTFGDPADTLEALLQRQSPMNGPSATQEFERGYALTYYRFDAGYEPLPVPAPRLEASVQGASGSLQSEGCAQLHPTRVGAGGGTLEILCFWRSLPYEKLPWDTRASLTLRDSSGRIVAHDEPLIARSGFPWFRYQGTITGVYLLTLPPGAAPGRHELDVQVPGRAPSMIYPVMLEE